jgi:hypothetical protein
MVFKAGSTANQPVISSHKYAADDVPGAPDDTLLSHFPFPGGNLNTDRAERPGFAAGFVTVCVSPRRAGGGRNSSVPSLAGRGAA